MRKTMYKNKERAMSEYTLSVGGRLVATVSDIDELLGYFEDFEQCGVDYDLFVGRPKVEYRFIDNDMYCFFIAHTPKLMGKMRAACDKFKTGAWDYRIETVTLIPEVKRS